MRVVLDTNIFVSALLADTSPPAQILTLWRAGKFRLLTAPEQLDELGRVTRYPKIRARLAPALASRLIDEIRGVALMVETLPLVERSPDPYDNYLLALAEAGNADYLVTGDKIGLLALGYHRGTRILTARDFCDLQR
jgi:hypothetical protein